MKVITVGRGKDNNIVINDSKVSRVHLQIVQDDKGNISIVDLNSANGTYVNGRRIMSETRLNPGDTVRIGDSQLNWNSFFSGATSHSMPFSSKSKTSTTQNVEHPRKEKKWIFIIGGILLAGLVIVTVILLQNSNDKKKQEQIDTPKEQPNDDKIKILEAERDAAKAEAEYQQALRKAAETKSERDKKIADSLKTILQSAAKKTGKTNPNSNTTNSITPKTANSQDISQKPAQKNETATIVNADKKNNGTEDVSKAKTPEATPKPEKKEEQTQPSTENSNQSAKTENDVKTNDKQENVKEQGGNTGKSKKDKKKEKKEKKKNKKKNGQ